MSRNGKTMIEMLQKMKRQYQEQVGPDVAIESNEFATWLLKQGWKVPRPRTPQELLVRDIGRAMRAEHRRDEVFGFDYRANIAYRIFTQAGEQFTFWVDPDRASKNQVQLAFQQRRQQIFGDCRGLANDRDHFNRVRGGDEGPINMTFDFDLDIEEARALQQQVDADSTQADIEDDDGDDKL